MEANNQIAAALQTLNAGTPVEALLYTPYFGALQNPPARVGPYECQMVAPYGDVDKPDATHMRWFNGTHWSLPIDHDPDLDDEIKLPPDEDFIRDDTDDLLARFMWRGLADDPNPDEL